MKKSIIAVIFAAVAIGAFTLYQFKSKNIEPPINISLLGKWKVDSVYKDGFVTDSLHKLMETATKQTFKFNSDSILNRLSSKDSIIEKYYIKDSTLFIQYNNNQFLPNTILLLNDSTLKTINYKDSFVFVFKKQ